MCDKAFVIASNRRHINKAPLQLFKISLTKNAGHTTYTGTRTRQGMPENKQLAHELYLIFLSKYIHLIEVTFGVLILQIWN